MAATTDRRPLGILGGTFDPVHLGHLIIAEELRFRLGLSTVLFLPSGRPPHKTDRDISPDRHRVSMLELAIRDNPAFALSLLDIEREGLSFTADSLAVLRQQHPEAELYFLMGEDSLRDLPSWHDPNRIARQAILAVARRPGITVNLPQVLEQVPDGRGRVRIVDVPLIDISSSDLRRRVRAGEPIRYQVPPAVERYISDHRLYRPDGPPLRQSTTARP